MRTTLARPASLALGFILVFALAWQAWGAFVGDQIPASAVSGGGGSSSSGSLALTGVVGEATTTTS